MPILVSQTAPLEYQQVDSAQAVGVAAANSVAEVIRANPKAVILFPTGKTPLPMYAKLREMDINWSETHLFHLDEYVPTKAHGHNSGLHQSQTFGAYMNRELWNQPTVRTADRHYFQDNIHKPTRYEETLNKLGGADLVILGIGLNGHIAFIEPDFDPRPASPVWKAHRIQLAQSTIDANFPDKDETGYAEEAVTLGLETILASKRVLLLASGQNKQSIMAQAFGAEVLKLSPTPALPATYLRTHPQLTIIADFALS